MNLDNENASALERQASLKRPRSNTMDGADPLAADPMAGFMAGLFAEEGKDAAGSVLSVSKDAPM